MRLLHNGVHTKFPSHLTRRPATSPRISLLGRQQRNKKSTESSKESPSEPAGHNTSSESPSTPPPTNSAASSAGASTPPLTNIPTARSFRQIIQDGPVGRAGRSYSRVQDRRPYMTQVCSSIVIYLFGDLSAQFFFPSEPNRPAESRAHTVVEDTGTDGTRGGTGGYDPLRTLRHLVVGVGSSIPSYNWIMYLHNNFNFASKFLSILTKVVIQQVCFTPVFNAYFFSVHSILSGATMAETLERVSITVPVSIVNSAKLWPAVTAFSFMYVPPQFRNVFAGVIAVGWQTYLSWLNQEAAREVELEDGGGSPPSNDGLRAKNAVAPA